MTFFGKFEIGGILLLAIIVPAWWLGASTSGGQWALLGLGALALVANRLARTDESAGDGSEEEKSSVLPGMGKAGRCCAVAAALFLGWVLVQGVNPSHVLVPALGQAVTTVGGLPVELVEKPHVAWLPSGLATPFARVGNDAMPHGNAWRQLLIFGGVFFLGWAVVRVVDRGVRVKTVLEWGTVHAVAFSAVALAHNLSDSALTYWRFYDPVYRMGGPQFPNDNQQVAYQLLLLAIAVAACLARGTLSPFPGLAGRRSWLIAGAVIVYAGTVTCRPRSGLLLGTMLVAGALMLKGWRARPERRRLVVWIALVGALALGVALMTVRPLRETVARFGEFAGHPSALLTGGSFRPIQHKVAWLMVEERPVLGWGGGSYLYLSPAHARRVPELMSVLKAQGQNHWPVFPHADGDWLEFLVEYGLAGAALLLTVAGVWAGWVMRRIRGLDEAALVLAGGVAVVLVQGMIDPVLRNPAVLGAMVLMAWLVVVAPRRRGMTNDQ